MSGREVVDETLFPTDWNTYLKASILNQNEYDKLSAIELYVKDPIALVAKIEELGVVDYASTLQNVVGKVSDARHLHRILFVIRTLLTSSPRFADAFINNGDPYTPLRTHMNKDDLPVIFNLFASLGIVIEKKYNPEYATVTMKEVVEYLGKGISEGKGKGAYMCLSGVRALTGILQRREVRKTFCNERGPFKLFQILQAYPVDVQLVYETTFCVWLLTYYLKEDKNIFDDMNLVPTLHQTLKSIREVKVVRITLMALKNLLRESKFIKDFISVGGPKTFLNLSKKNFEDEDVNALVAELLRSTENFIDELSTFDEYRQEVLSGALATSPAHDSDKFWKQNIDRFEENNFYLVKQLIELLKTSSPKVQSIALKDIGNFVIHYGEGRSIIAELGGKGACMALMESPDEQVRSQALNTTQKIMLQNWAYLQ